ncbi:hypothetical protein NX059_000149 [Plenodomus lindquistii]|nr:hypothetical protein NX059_000149 [Plenodomus lindquistii]
MEVDAETFPYHLLGLFIHISEADFVSFDLELSGIPSRIPNKPARGRGRLTLEQRYAETKLGADRYQILQVGITCARFDYIANKYVLRPYNINISPLLDERLDFEREISFQTGACTFLINNGFDLGAPFASGVQYLSRQEAARAKQMAWDRLEKKNPVEDMQVKEGDVDSLDFMRRVREAITKWKTTKSECLEITTHTGQQNAPPVQAISRFEKRLVHQLVRAEFPEQVSIGRHNCIRIIHLDAEREADNIRRIKGRIKEQIIRQTGFRWIFEALVKGGDIDRADPLYLPRISSGAVMTSDTFDIKDRYDRAVERLKTRQPVLVGHNMFTDIVYFTAHLLESYPIHCKVSKKPFTSFFQGSSTQNIWPHMPKIITHSDHPKYEDTEAFHEAGYDSLLTATIMIRLAANLGTERTAKPSDGSFANGRSIATALSDFMRDGREKVNKPVPLPPVADCEDPATALPSASRRRKNKKAKKAAQQAAKGRFQTTNVFDNLLALNLDAGTDAEISSSDEKEPVLDFGAIENAKWDQGQEQPAGSWENDEYVQDTTGWVPIEQIQRLPMEMIPAFDDAFWGEFGNKLRVFGTEEAVLDIAPWES